MNPIAVKGLIINATGEILIFKRAEQEGLEGKYKGFLDLPGGGAKRESARFAMARELAEEAGIYMDPESLPKSKITNIYVDEYAMEVELHLFKIQLDHTP